MEDMKLSFLIPAYNAGKYIEQCVLSILKNQSKDIEVVIVVQESKDDTYKIAKELMAKDSRIILCSQKKLGVSAARNYAMKLASGDYYIFVDADDWINSEMIPLISRELKGNTYNSLIVDALYYNMDQFEEIDYKFDEIEINEKNKNDFIVALFTQTELNAVWGKVFSSELIKKNNIKFDESMIFAEDLTFVIDYFTCEIKCKYIKEIFYYYRNTPGSATDRFELQYITDMFKACANKVIAVKKFGLSEGKKTIIKNYCNQQLNEQFDSFCRTYEKQYGEIL